MKRSLLGILAMLGIAIFATFIPGQEYHSGKVWSEPKVIDPGSGGQPPSDAIVLFDGKDLSKWLKGDKWLIKEGAAITRECDIITRQSFGDCQLHVEWATPDVVQGEGQGRGNSGVFLQDRYEVQILDSYQNKTYYDGQAGAIYKQHPPMVNACRRPGEWQAYDIIFEAPRFDEAGKLLKSAKITVLHNGVLVQNHFEVLGSTSWYRAPAYQAHPPRQPLRLQYHGNAVRYRNIWIREL